MVASSKSAAPRPRDATATRAAILESARTAFAAKGYDGAGVREIAAGAGVTAMLVNRYFGSKEELFAEVVEQTMTSGSVIAGGILERPNPGRALAEAVVGMSRAGAEPAQGFLITFHSASSPVAADIGREQIVAHHLKRVTEALAGRDTEQRAALILAVISGFQVMRQMLALPPLAQGNEDDLVDLLAGVFDTLIESGEQAASGDPGSSPA